MRKMSRMRAISLSAAAMEEADLEVEDWIERVVWALSCRAEIEGGMLAGVLVSKRGILGGTSKRTKLE